MRTGDLPGDGFRRVRNIGELAKLAGVSAGTVSRALAGKALVNAETRERIQAIAREHGFRPNQMASKLRTRRTGVIGVVIPLGHERSQHISDPFFMTLLGHLADGLTENGFDLMLSRVVPDSGDWLDRIADSGMLEGVLLIGQSNQFDAIERVAESYRPLVVWGEHREGQRHCAVGSDNRTGGRLAAQHMIDRGCRRLVYFGDVQPPEISERFRGANEAAHAAGLPDIEIVATPFAAAEVQDNIAERILRMPNGTDGIIAASDVIAMTTLRALADNRMAVPGQVAVIGFDDLSLATQTVPRLTTIRQDLQRGAQAMVAALFERIKGVDTPSLVMQPELIVRDSA